MEAHGRRKDGVEMNEFIEHDGGKCPVHRNLTGSTTIEVEMRGGYTLKKAANRIVWKHSGKDGDVLRWRMAFPKPKPATEGDSHAD